MGEQPPKVPAQTIRVPIQEVVKQNRIRIKNLEVNLQALQNDFAELVAFVNAGGEPDPADLASVMSSFGMDNIESIEAREKRVFQAQSDAPACFECGSLMVRNGSCYRCDNCGSTSGCS